jgi:hypothetical protein
MGRPETRKDPRICRVLSGVSGRRPLTLSHEVRAPSSVVVVCGASLHRPPAASRRRPRTLRSAATPARVPSLGFRRSLCATSAGDVYWLDRAPSSILTVHPRRFARPRWVLPSPASRVCFTPLPRPGFSPSGVCPSLGSRSAFPLPLPSVLSAAPTAVARAIEDPLGCRALLSPRVRCRPLPVKDAFGPIPSWVFLLRVSGLPSLRAISRPGRPRR